jgi:hypothetical protein
MKRYIVVPALLLFAAPTCAQHPIYGVGGDIKPDTKSAAVAEIHPSIPRFEIFFGGSVSRLGAALPNNYPGWQAAFDWNLTQHFTIVADGGLQSESFSNLTRKQYQLTAGPELRLHGRASPFVHILAGLTRQQGGIFDLTGLPENNNSNGLLVMAGGGIDVGISQHFAIRAQADYLAPRYSSWTDRSVRVGAGIVIRFGGSKPEQQIAPAVKPPSAPAYRDVMPARKWIGLAG